MCIYIRSPYFAVRGQTLRGLIPQNNPAMNPATLEEHHKDGQMSTLLSKEIRLQDRGRPNGPRSARLRHLTSHSPVAKSVAGFFAGLFAGVDHRKVGLRKRLHKMRRPVLVNLHIHTHTHTYIHTHTHTNTHVYIYIYVHMNSYIHTYKHTHTYTQTHGHTQCTHNKHTHIVI